MRKRVSRGREERNSRRRDGLMLLSVWGDWDTSPNRGSRGMGLDGRRGSLSFVVCFVSRFADCNWFRGGEVVGDWGWRSQGSGGEWWISRFFFVEDFVEPFPRVSVREKDRQGMGRRRGFFVVLDDDRVRGSQAWCAPALA